MTEATAPATGKSGPHLMVIGGTDDGKIYPLQSPGVVLDENLHVVAIPDGSFLLQETGEADLRINEERVTEKILEDGDKIVYTGGTLSYHATGRSARGKAGQRMSPERAERVRRLTIIGLVMAVVVWMGWQQGWLPGAPPGVGPDWDAAHRPASMPTPTPTPETVPADEGDEEQKILMARTRYEIGLQHYRDRRAARENLFRAIREWERVIEDVKDIDPQPEVYQLARDHLEEAQKMLAAEISALKARAFVAKQLGDKTRVKQILLDIQARVPDMTNTDYVWAQSKLSDLQ